VRRDSNPNVKWKAILNRAEKIGRVTRECELKKIK